ncbi:hypothetical protein [Desulfosporosinus burensis]
MYIEMSRFAPFSRSKQPQRRTQYFTSVKSNPEIPEQSPTCVRILTISKADQTVPSPGRSVTERDVFTKAD